MNYLKQYIKLIRRAETRIKENLVEPYEMHHVFPKSVYGKNKRLVALTLKEHYVAHALLEKIFLKRYGKKDQRTIKMIRAFFMMNNYNHKKIGHYNSRLYESTKLRYRDSVRGIPRSPEVVSKISKPKRQGHGEAVSKARKGIKFSEEHINNLKKAHKRRTYYKSGYKLTEERKNKLKEAAKKRPPVTDEKRMKLSESAKKAWAKKKELAVGYEL